MTIDECFERRQLRLIRPDPLKADKSVHTAEEKLAEAEQLMKAGFGNAAVVTAYAAMFHAGRALLFKDGVLEKSHFCLAEYIREKYAKSGKLKNGIVTVMDSFREERHDVMYGLGDVRVKESDVRAAIENAKEMLLAVRKLIV